MSERLAIFAEGLFAEHSGKTAHGVIRYGNRDVVAVIDSTCAGPHGGRGRALLPCTRCRSSRRCDEAIERGADERC